MWNNFKDEKRDNPDSNEVFAFKITEDSNIIHKNALDKYYIVFSEKELLFFSSEKKMNYMIYGIFINHIFLLTKKL